MSLKEVVEANSDYLNLLKYWHKVENFSPYVISESNTEKCKTYKIVNEQNFPWKEECDKYRKYTVYFGVFLLNKANKLIEQHFTQKSEFAPEDRKALTCMCTFMLNENAQYVKETYKLSTLPWAIGQVLNGNKGSTSWADDFEGFENKIKDYLHNITDEWTLEKFHNFKKFLSDELKWDIPYNNVWLYIDELKSDASPKNTVSKENNIASKKAEYSVEEDEELDIDKKRPLLNSFYVRELEKIITQIQDNKFGKGFSNFLASRKETAFDIQNDLEQIKKCTSPKHIPLGRWPSEHNLSLMQQIAVNIARSDELRPDSLFSVNGPPGTGKTTLLKDIIASIVVDRANVMAEFNSPRDAFKEIEIITASDKFNAMLYELDSKLKDFGIVVASSNNGAVENITAELPAMSSIPDKYRENIKEEISNLEKEFLNIRKSYQNKEYDNQKKQKVPLPKYGYFPIEAKTVYGQKEYWGLISAVLGKSRNRYKFVEKISGFNKTDYESTMLEALNKNVYIPTPWDEARENFKKKYSLAQKARDKLIDYEKNLKNFNEYENEKSKLLYEATLCEENFNNIELEIANGRKKSEKTSKELFHADKLYNIYKDKYTILDKLLFFTAKSKNLKAQLSQAECDYKKAFENDIAVNKWLEYQENRKTEQIKKKLSLVAKVNDIQQKINKSALLCDEAKEELGANFPDEHYWEDTEHAQINCVWISKRFNDLREELFFEALRLHQSFILNSKELKSNLRLFFNLLRGTLENNYKKKYSAELLQSFFLLVPVISTTFASVGSFFKYIGPEEIGWLLIDEAGQATPQAAVGAIWRSKRTIVVGDPLQIEPVVTIPQIILDKFRENYQILEKYSNKAISVQALADSHNFFGTNRVLGEGNVLWVGCPLRVHRRCLNPMFDIANEIAYEGTMICATNTPKNKNLVMNECQWVDINGQTDIPHYISEQGEFVYSLISKHFLEDENKIPSLYVISPFVTVKNELIRLLVEENRLYIHLNQNGKTISKTDVNNWVSKNIGTIHTFQGKEADTVILLLGCDVNNKGLEAAKWAASSPNILNVAVTRAKYRFIIVGDTKLWSSLSYFKTAYEKIKKNG